MQPEAVLRIITASKRIREDFPYRAMAVPRYEKRPRPPRNFIKREHVARRAAGQGDAWEAGRPRAQKIDKPPGGLVDLARLEGFEPPTFWSVARHSIQLS